MSRISKNSVGIAGEFAALSQLALRGYEASLTLGNTKSIDILVFDPATKRASRLEVKTNYERRSAPTNSKLFGKIESSWQMHKKHETVSDPDLFYCFVQINSQPTNRPDHTFRFFIVPSQTVADYVRLQHKMWLADDDSHFDTDRRIFRIASPDDRKVKIPAPLATDFEDNWTRLASPAVEVRIESKSESET